MHEKRTHRVRTAEEKAGFCLGQLRNGLGLLRKILGQLRNSSLLKPLILKDHSAAGAAPHSLPESYRNKSPFSAASKMVSSASGFATRTIFQFSPPGRGNRERRLG